MYKIDDEMIAVIESVLNAGNRVEIIPLKDRLKIINVRREDVTPCNDIVIKERPQN